MTGKEPWGVVGARFPLMLACGLLGSLWLCTQPDGQAIGALALVVFAIIGWQRFSESHVSEDREIGLRQLDARRSWRGVAWLLLVPIAYLLFQSQLGGAQ